MQVPLDTLGLPGPAGPRTHAANFSKPFVASPLALPSERHDDHHDSRDLVPPRTASTGFPSAVNRPFKSRSHPVLEAQPPVLKRSRTRRLLHASRERWRSFRTQSVVGDEQGQAVPRAQSGTITRRPSFDALNFWSRKRPESMSTTRIFSIVHDISAPREADDDPNVNLSEPDQLLDKLSSMDICSKSFEKAFIPPNTEFEPWQGEAARAFAASINQRNTSPELPERKDSDTLLPPMLEARESALALHEDSVVEDDKRMRRDSVVKRLDPVKYLPTEVASLIFQHLDLNSVLSAGRVSRKWYMLAQDRQLWRSAFMSRFRPRRSSVSLPAPVGGQGIGRAGNVERDWRLMYKARLALETNWKRKQCQPIYLSGHTDSVYCVQYDEDQIITGSRDRTIRIWDAHTYELRKIIGTRGAFYNDRRSGDPINPPYKFPVNAIVQPSPKESHPRESLYHVPSYHHEQSILCLQYDDEIVVTGSSDYTLIVWDIKTWTPIRQLRKHTMGVLDVAFDKEKIVSCSKDTTICIWDRETGQLLQNVKAHNGPVNAIQLRGNLVVSASGEGCARLWNLNFLPRRDHPEPWESKYTCEARCVKEFWSKDRGLACVEYSADGAILAGGNDHVIYKFDTSTGEPRAVQELSGHENLVRSLYLDGANGRIISGSYDLSLKVWDYEKGEVIASWPEWTSSWMLAAKMDYRKIVGTSQDGRVLVLDFGHGVEGIDLLEG